MQDVTNLVAELRERIRILESIVERAFDGTGNLRAEVIAGSNVHTHSGGGQGGPISGARVTSFIEFDEVAAPGTPSSARVRIYAKSDGRLYSKDDAGTESGPL